jgi:hypothetical protein
VAFLQSLRPEFEEAQKKRTTHHFWPILFEEFYKKYPTPQSELDERVVEDLEDASRADEATSMGTSKAKARAKKAKTGASKAKREEWPVFETVEAWREKRETVSMIS